MSPNQQHRRFEAALEHELDPMPPQLRDRTLRASARDQERASRRVANADLLVGRSRPPTQVPRTRLLLAVAVACYALGTIITIAVERIPSADATVFGQNPAQEVYPDSSKALLALLSDLQSVHVHARLGPALDNSDASWEFLGETLGEPLAAESIKLLRTEMQDELRDETTPAVITHAPSARVVFQLGGPARYVTATMDYHSPSMLRVGKAGTFQLSEELAKRLVSAVQIAQHRTLMQRGMVFDAKELQALPANLTSLTYFDVDQDELAATTFSDLEHVDLASLRADIHNDLFAWLLARPKLASFAARPEQLNANRLRQLGKLGRLRTLALDGRNSAQLATPKSCAKCHKQPSIKPAIPPNRLRGLSQLSSLRRLGMRWLVVPPEAAKALAEMPTLETLDLTGADLKDFPVGAISTIPVLRELILQQTSGITDEFVNALATIHHLRRLDLRDAPEFGDKRVRQLVKALPRCEVLLSPKVK